MAELQGINAAKRKGEPVQLVDVCEQGGRLKLAYDKHSVAATNGDTILMGELPAGAKPYKAEVVHGACGAGCLLDIGYTGSLIAFADDYDAAAAGSSAFYAPQSKLSAAADVIVSVSGANKAAVDLEVIIYYSVD